MFTQWKKKRKWRKKFINSLRNHPEFRKDIWDEYWKTLGQQKLKGVFYGAVAFAIILLILLIALIDQTIRHELLLFRLLTVGFCLFTGKCLLSNINRLHQPLVDASKTLTKRIIAERDAAATGSSRTTARSGPSHSGRYGTGLHGPGFHGPGFHGGPHGGGRYGGGFHGGPPGGPGGPPGGRFGGPPGGPFGGGFGGPGGPGGPGGR